MWLQSRLSRPSAPQAPGQRSFGLTGEAGGGKLRLIKARGLFGGAFDDDRRNRLGARAPLNRRTLGWSALLASTVLAGAPARAADAAAANDSSATSLGEIIVTAEKRRRTSRRCR